ncbi:hypothetical protein [Waddlia chondrophila]|uniref:Uncharacterized protein n=1 Tax=Waddlia chondrophila (strain ATCC VR-1470 / WSU 86-1044) TaxID=716544 RepID=D6YUG0_WADCW|nr:hypothetical protein [Waddlia chondrophila]ADI37771.1 hypothetical protein wcw_0399 [Waddlia chondrophila WSU 86-1044]
MTPFQGFKHGELTKIIHENPEVWSSLFFGPTIGKPREKEAVCHEVLAYLGYSLSEISTLHDCDFDIQKFMDQKGDETVEKTNKKAASVFVSPKEIPIPPSNSYKKASSLLSYVPSSSLENLPQSEDLSEEKSPRKKVSDPQQEPGIPDKEWDEVFSFFED